jgi:DNA polymerase-3 subunit beta
MKIVCDKNLLVDAVLNVSRAVSVKSTIMALEGILIKAQDNKSYHRL